MPIETKMRTENLVSYLVINSKISLGLCPVVLTDVDGNDTITIKHMSYFAITYDHRLVDGADADHFMNHVKQTLVEESWSELDPFL